MSVILLTKQKEQDFETIQLLTKFLEKNIKVKVCYFKNFDIITNHGVFYNSEPLELPKIVLVRLGAGISRAELSIVRYFELNGVKCINTSTSIDIVQDKFRTSEILSHHGINVPSSMIIKSPSQHALVESRIGFPCIVKVIVGSFGEGIYLCNSKQEYNNIIEFIDALHNEKTLIVQEYLSQRPGEDLRVFVVDNNVIGVMKRKAQPGDFRANISHGGTGESYPLSDDIRDIALKTANILDLNIAGIDLLFDERGFFVCEANSNPGFSGFNKYCNADIASIIVNYIDKELKKYDV